MGIAISASSGIILGVSLLIWALKERTKRHDAEIKYLHERKIAEAAERTALNNHRAVVDLESEKGRMSNQMAALRYRIDELEKRLLACNDPVASKKMLAEKLKEQEL